ncbi:sensor histidine kinase [Gordonia sp. OPL2]|uniref:sensor histidine kinase n=1 Tax=Gordonia sp. OPL2 TaxID=2486274 RepID=UPI00165568A9|nr:ATP-binding protein [Gordonia sp. OPL2]ROZ98648.1 hypothetical protein EEB19_14810 [Gordonia sp. OPL2]
MTDRSPGATADVWSSGVLDRTPERIARSDAPGSTGGGDREVQRVVRSLARVIACGYLAFLITSIPEIGPASAIVAAWYTPVALILAFGPGLALLPAGLWRRGRYIALCCRLAVVGYFLASALWLVAWNGAVLDAERATWLVSFSGLPGVAAALAIPSRRAAGVVVAGTMMAAVITYFGRTDVEVGYLVLETVFASAFASVFLATALTVLRTGRLLDATRIDAYRAAAATAAAKARDIQRRRFDALVHDHVLATLLEASAGSSGPELAEQARSALSRLDDLAAGRAPMAPDQTAAEVITALRAGIAASGEDAGVLRDRVTEPAAVFPVDVVLAVVDATGEAVRNVVRHAGTSAACVVLADIAADRIAVTVADDGVGFHPERVDPARVGIEVSLRQRVESVGGTAAIRSSPGSGTVVEVSWSRR